MGIGGNMNLEDIKKTIEAGKKLKHNISVRDISYVLLLKSFDDKKIAFKAIWGNECDDLDMDEYTSSKKILFLKTYLTASVKEEEKSIDIDNFDAEEIDMDITFEENKAGLIKLLHEVEAARKKKVLEAKDALKMQIDIRSKLNDKFGASEKDDKDCVVMVEPKFNYICPYTQKECYVNSKEQCMKRYNLIEKENNNDLQGENK